MRVFSSVFVNQNLVNPSSHQRRFAEISNVEFASSDLEDQLGALHPISAMGPDNLHPSFLKRCAFAMVRPFCFLFRKSMDAGVVLDLWKHSFITPIF